MEMAFTMKMLYAKAMAMAPPASAALARKRSWAEMAHIQTLHSDEIPAQCIATSAAILKKNKRTLGACMPTAACCEASDACAVCMPPSCPLSGEAQRFLAENPFDDLPHPVLKRQQAVHTHIDCFRSLGDMEIASDDSDYDDMMGQDPRMGTPLNPSPPSRWNASIVGASLTHIGRHKSSTLQQRRM